jgi:hypothetical protein
MLTWIGRHRKCIATPHASLNRYRGIVDGNHKTELFADAAVFGSGTPQEVADRVAATLSATGTDEDAFYAAPR